MTFQPPPPPPEGRPPDRDAGDGARATPRSGWAPPLSQHPDVPPSRERPDAPAFAPQPRYTPPPQYPPRPTGEQPPADRQPGPPPAPWGPPPAQWSPPPAPPGPTGRSTGRPGAGRIDPAAVHRLDWGILAAGVVALFCSFVSYYTYAVGRVEVSWSAWHGFFGWFAALLALIGSAAVGAELFLPRIPVPAAHRSIGLAAYTLATLSVLLALVVTPALGRTGIGAGHGAGYWISLVVIVAGLLLSLERFRQTGGTLPAGRKRDGARGSGVPRS